MKQLSKLRNHAGRFARSCVAVVAVTSIFAAKALTDDARPVEAGPDKDVTEIAQAPTSSSLR